MINIKFVRNLSAICVHCASCAEHVPKFHLPANRSTNSSRFPSAERGRARTRVAILEYIFCMRETRREKKTHEKRRNSRQLFIFFLFFFQKIQSTLSCNAREWHTSASRATILIRISAGLITRANAEDFGTEQHYANVRRKIPLAQRANAFYYAHVTFILHA